MILKSPFFVQHACNIWIKSPVNGPKTEIRSLPDRICFGGTFWTCQASGMNSEVIRGIHQGPCLPAAVSRESPCETDGSISLLWCDQDVHVGYTGIHEYPQISNLNITLHVLVLVRCVKCAFMHMARTFLDQVTQRCSSQVLFRFGQLIILPPLSRRTYHSFLGGGNSNISQFSIPIWGFMLQFDLRIFFKWVGVQPSTSQLCFESFGSHLFFSEPIPGIWLLKCSSVGLAWTIGFENSARNPDGSWNAHGFTPLEVGGSQHFAPKKSYHKTA